MKSINYSVKAKGHTPQYRMHKYFARRPYNVFRNLIDYYTQPGDIILDCFCGGGVTIFESLYLKRKVIGVDINPLATFITSMQIKQYDLNDLKEYLHNFIDEIKDKYMFFYRIDLDNESGILEWTEWAYEVSCPECNSTIPLSSDYKIRDGIYRCPNDQCTNNSKGVKRTNCKAQSSRPLRIKYISDSTKLAIIKNLSNQESDNIIKTKNTKYIHANDIVDVNIKIPQNWDRQFEDCLEQKGIITYKDFFTDRNYMVNLLIFNDILKLKNTLPLDIVNCIYFIFSSSLRYTNNMTRVTDNWEGGNPTAMDKHAFWLPNQYIETNAINIFEKRAKAILDGLAYTNKQIPHKIIEASDFAHLKEDADFMILNQSSSYIPIPDKSVSAVITDPPYGSNVQYGELSTIWNTWYMKYKTLDSFIYNDEEAVINRKAKFEGSKNTKTYEEILYTIFKECHRVLKDDGYLVFTFNNKNIKVWMAILRAVARAGFYLPEDGVIFQDFIQSYKNTSHLKYPGNIHGDFIYSFRKIYKQKPTKTFTDKLVDIIDDRLRQTINELFTENSYYSTTVLYQMIFSSLANVLMEYVLSDITQSNESIISEYEKYSDKYIYETLKKYLIFDGEHWYTKGVSIIYDKNIK